MNAHFELDHVANTLTVCAWCYPGKSVLTLPEFTKAAIAFHAGDLKLTHGCCKDCRERMKAELRRQQELKDLGVVMAMTL
jgi:hypothetical protein